VEQSLKDGNFDAATKKVQLLPRSQAHFSWDDSKVPPNLREAYASARDMGIEAWKKRLVTEFDLSPGGAPDIKFGFEPKLAKEPGTEIPAGVVNFVSETTLPRIESVLGLIRGSESRPAGIIDVQNDVEFAIGTYLGVAQSPLPTTSLSHSNTFSIVANTVTPFERMIAKKNLEAVEVLRKAIHARQRMIPAAPSAVFESVDLKTGPILQGNIAVIPFVISNIGQGELTYEILPECQCITTGPAGSLKPNEVRSVDINVDTTNWSHDLFKKLTVVTNDPVNPILTVPLTVKINPRYRWIVPGGMARVIPDSGSDIYLYLDLPLDSQIYPNGVHFDGVNATAKIEQWKGDLADPDNGEGVLPRFGYRVKLHVDGNIPGGRQVGTVTITTSSEQFPSISYNLSFQKGIIALPDDLNLGALTGTSKTFFVTLTRPGAHFRVLSVSPSSKSIKATVGTVPNTDDYRIGITYVGKAKTGDFVAVVHIYTDDPRQPRIDVSVRGTVE